MIGPWLKVNHILIKGEDSYEYSYKMGTNA